MLSILGRCAACSLGTALIYAITSRIFDAFAVAPLTIVFASPMWMIAFARYLVELMPAFHRKAKRDALEVWNGRYYAYGMHQLRLFLIDEVIWIPAADLAAILAPPPDQRELRYLGAEQGTIPGQKMLGFTEAGLLRLLATRTGTRRATHDMIRFKHWLEKETLPNLRRLPSSAI